ncbi:serine hydrolase [Streptomyces sp. CHD11]|nr:serine hydrolase [Streptomyces sp. CHD11]
MTLGGCTGGPGAGAESARSPAPQVRNGESVADFLRRTLPVGPSGTVIAARGDRLAYCGGFGTADRTAGAPASCLTVYDVASITKQFTAAAIVKLEVMGRLRVSDPISRFLRRGRPVPEDKRAITIEHLLTHTSGVAEALGDDYDPLSREELVSRALSSGLRSAPGEEFRYSNTGYSLLAVIVEEASGESYERFLARHLFEPAGMKQTGPGLRSHADRSPVVGRPALLAVAPRRPRSGPVPGCGPRRRTHESDPVLVMQLRTLTPARPATRPTVQ